MSQDARGARSEVSTLRKEVEEQEEALQLAKQRYEATNTSVETTAKCVRVLRAHAATLDAQVCIASSQICFSCRDRIDLRRSKLLAAARAVPTDVLLNKCENDGTSSRWDLGARRD